MEHYTDKIWCTSEGGSPKTLKSSTHMTHNTHSTQQGMQDHNEQVLVVSMVRVLHSHPHALISSHFIK